MWRVPPALRVYKGVLAEKLSRLKSPALPIYLKQPQHPTPHVAIMEPTMAVASAGWAAAMAVVMDMAATLSMSVVMDMTLVKSLPYLLLFEDTMTDSHPPNLHLMID